MKPVSIDDYRQLAQRRLPHFLFEYIDGGAVSESTLRRNVSDLQDIAVRQRVLRDVSTIDTSSSLLGQQSRLPLVLAPIGLAGMAARRGEVQAARAAEAFGVPFCLSTVSACPIDEVSNGTKSPFWFQMYMIRDRAFMADLLVSARQAKCPALVFTIDMPVPGTRYRDHRSGLAGSPGLGGAMRRAFQAAQHPRWAFDVGLMGGPHVLGNVVPVLKGRTGLEDFFAWMSANFDPTVTWADLEWVRKSWDGPLVVKGILDAEDAIQAFKMGADGIVVSNHGGRQLDGASSTAKVIASVREAVGPQATVLADGGVRSGLDVLRMLALGASGVQIGRPWVYALAGRGQAGVAHILQLFEAEIRVAMALCGVTSIRAVTRDLLA
jgi:L-lactate dehydrogenase (cytochrome)